MATNDFTLELTHDNIKTIRHALLIGLSCHIEIERVLDRAELAATFEFGHDAQLLPTHPTDRCTNTAATFARALSLLN